MKRALSRKNLWERAPRPVKSVVGIGLRLVPMSYLMGGRFRETARFLERAQWWTREQSREYQLKKLKALCELAAQKSEYYRDAFRAAGFEPGDLRSVEELSGLPTIDKDTVRDHAEAMCCRDVAAPGVDYTTTGGTGGNPLRFYIGADRSAVEIAYLYASWGRAGYKPDVSMAVFRGRVVPEETPGFHHEYDLLLRHHYYSNFHMTDENMRRYLEHIRGIGDCFLHVYPSSVATLARFVHRSGMAPPKNIRGIIAESEIVYPEQRKMAEAVFGCRYFSCYGHTEKLVMTAECEHSPKGHVWPTYGYFELLDESGKPVMTPGQRGEIVGTGFINTVMPFIRYRTGDLATYVGEKCDACGREHTMIEEVRGHRTQEMLIAADGAAISWTALNMHDDTFDNVARFRFRQDTPGRATLMIVPAPSMTERDEERILRNVAGKLGDRLIVSLERHESIPLSPQGKAIYVEQLIPQGELVET